MTEEFLDVHFRLIPAQKDYALLHGGSEYIRDQ